jgi:hypothetical protein
MSSSQLIPPIAWHLDLLVVPRTPNRAEQSSAHFFFSFLENTLAGVVGRQNSRPTRLLAVAVWNFEQPRPRWVTTYRTNVLYCAKGQLFARAELAMLCECREPFGFFFRGVRAPPVTTPCNSL